MKRREFLRNSIPAAVAVPTIINGIPLTVMGSDSPLIQSLMGFATETDHVLVLIQMNGGNDGLNTLIPLEFYSAYNNARANIAIPEDKVLKLQGNTKVGIHPAMTGLQALYNEGKVAFVQAVGYPAPNFSHFRATDIWMSGSDSNQFVNSGIAGRYLNLEYPNFPNGYPNSNVTDPIGIQIGSVTSLAFQGPAVSMGMSISDPVNFYNLVNDIDEPVPNTPAGFELSYLRTVAKQTTSYSGVIKKAALRVMQQSTYPTGNPLADQLKIVARLIKGGLKTRVYMVNIGGFDTHSAQVNTGDTSTGAHATLMLRLSGAIKAFMDDAKLLGIEKRILGMTFSEFGRRIKSNSSVGTDHGAAAPMILFGEYVKQGVLGNNPTIASNPTVNDNIPMQYDFRSVYATVMETWFCLKNSDLQTVMLKNYQTLPLVKGTSCNSMVPDLSGETLIKNYPNPFINSTTITFKTNGGHTSIQIMDTLGRVRMTLLDADYAVPGQYTVVFQSESLPTGVYYARLQNGPTQQVKAMLKVR